MNYTAEQVESHIACLEARDMHAEAGMLRDYAALLRERESVKPVAWLDMGKGEAQLVFSKKAQSNRAAKKEAIRLFESIPEGYHPLFLHPLMQSAKAAVTDEIRAHASFIYRKTTDGNCNELGMLNALEAVAPMLASARVPDDPTEEMLVAARDWSYRKYGKPIGNDDATGCWQAMLAAAPKPETEE